MKHFSFFPKFEYDKQLVTDIFRRGKIRDLMKKKKSLYYEYFVQRSNKPWHTCFQLYKGVEYTWTLFYVNEIFDPILDWPLGEREFDEFIKEKYNTDVVSDIKKPIGQVYNVTVAPDPTASISEIEGNYNPITRPLTVFHEGSLRTTPIKEKEIVQHPWREWVYVRVKKVIDENKFRIDETLAGEFTIDEPNLNLNMHTDTHSYKDKSTGFQVDYETWLSLPENKRNRITFYEYEADLNEKKRAINILSKENTEKLYIELQSLFKNR